MKHQKKQYKKSNCGCEKKQEPKNQTYKKCGCQCELNYYFPLPNLPTQPVSEKVGVLNWFGNGSVQTCCSICSTVNPVYTNPCNTCNYDKGSFPINNSAYFTTNQYAY